MGEQNASPLPASRKRKRIPAAVEQILPTPQPQHPYLSGNFAPIHQTLPLTPCSYTGEIPEELIGGQYVRNGSNPVSNDDLGRDAHWFDGDGMLAGVFFTRDARTGKIQPEFVNQFVLTDLYLSAVSSPRLRVPILPSIATLVNPLASFLWVTLRIFRTIFLVLLSHLPGSRQPIKKISVANTNVVYHDGRALATCESGPPMRIQLPGLETVGWFDGSVAEGEPPSEQSVDARVLGGDGGLIAFMREWTTAHPKVDPVTQEMMLFHSSFAPPYVQYSLIPPQDNKVQRFSEKSTPLKNKIVNAAVPGVTSAKMMHDFGCSPTHTVILDLPLSLDPMNQLAGRPPVAYDPSKPSRFGVFPRRNPAAVRWFETDACCIFHTANTWDELDPRNGEVAAVNMLACRLTSATLVFAAGNIRPPVEKRNSRVAVAPSRKKRMPFFSKYDDPDPDTNDDGGMMRLFDRTPRIEEDYDKEPLLRLTQPPHHHDVDDDDLSPEDLATFLDEEQCRLYYYSFSLSPRSPSDPTILHQWALTALPFEFPTVRADREMRAARFIYGCTTTRTASFGAALGKATKIDALVKIDAQRLIARGRARPPRGVTGVVDGRSVQQILEDNARDPQDPVRIFRLPEGWCAQECRFVPSSSSARDQEEGEEAEDAGHLLFYAFDESQLRASDGGVPDDADESVRARSELWILDARDMSTLKARIHLPQRVPYGLHGAWFGREMVEGQRAVERVRSGSEGKVVRGREEGEEGWGGKVWMGVRRAVEEVLG